MKKRFIDFLCLGLCALLLCSCATNAETDSPAPTPGTEKLTGYKLDVFDTVVTLTLYGGSAELMDEVWSACDRYEALLSKTVEGSDVYRINHAGGETVTVDPETWTILSRAKEMNRKTGGAFSVTIAPLTAQWDFTGGTHRMPTEAERLAALPLVDDEKLLLGENNTVKLPAGMEVDLGGIAKGYIADQIAQLLRGKVSGAIINLGGNVYVIGHKPDGSPFKVGIQDPSDATGQALAAVAATDVSVVTSGIYERGFTLDGVRYHHILDPKTGLPADSDLASASILLESSMDADALATACIVLGSQEAMALLNAEGLRGVLITREGKILTSRAFDEAYTLQMLK